MTPMQTQLIDTYWSMIRRRERDIRENGHRPCPCDVDDRWDFEFEDAYEVIHPLLVCINKPQIFVAVSSLPHLRGPFAAENAHQALMFQLNPAEAMYGDPSQLDSEKYLDIRNKAEAELAQLAAMDEIPVAVPVLPRVGTEIWNDNFVRGWTLPKPIIGPVDGSVATSITSLSHVLTSGQQEIFDVVKETPLSGKAIHKLLGGSYETVRKYVRVLMKMNLIHRVSQGYVRGPRPAKELSDT